VGKGTIVCAVGGFLWSDPCCSESRRGCATLGQVSFGERTANAVRIYAAYLGKTIWPTSLAIFYPYSHARLTAWATLIAFLFNCRDYRSCVLVGQEGGLSPFGWLVVTWEHLCRLLAWWQVGEPSRWRIVILMCLFLAFSSPVTWGVSDLGKGSRMLLRMIAAAAVAVLCMLFVCDAHQQDIG